MPIETDTLESWYASLRLRRPVATPHRMLVSPLAKVPENAMW